MSYDALRQFADSWGLVLMGALFVAFVGWTFRRHAHADHETARQSIFRDEDGVHG